VSTLQWFFERYLPGVDTEDWRASPMRAASLAGLPPMQVICAECDPLVDDCLAFVRARARAKAARWSNAHVFEGVVHGFYTLGKLIPEAREAVALSAAALRSHLAECATVLSMIRQAGVRRERPAAEFSRRRRRSAPDGWRGLR
jgi:acetyl esterase